MFHGRTNSRRRLGRQQRQVAAKAGFTKKKIKIHYSTQSKKSADNSLRQAIEPTIVYDSLMMALDYDGECANRGCRHYPNATTELSTDEGKKDIVVCSKCGLKMKPKDQRW